MPCQPRRGEKGQEQELALHEPGTEVGVHALGGAQVQATVAGLDFHAKLAQLVEQRRGRRRLHRIRSSSGSEEAGEAST